MFLHDKHPTITKNKGNLYLASTSSAFFLAARASCSFCTKERSLAKGSIAADVLASF